jgi:dTDP-4-amino-4,6-dideoxygalactose transaminase
VFRSQGEPRRYVTELLGYNYRMTEIAAALGHAQIPKIDARNETRRQNAARLTELLSTNKSVITPSELPERRHVWHQYTVRVRAGRAARDRLQVALRERGIETGVFYPTPIPAQPLYQRLGYGDAHVPAAVRLAEEVLSLPVHPALAATDLETIATAVNELAV